MTHLNAPDLDTSAVLEALNAWRQALPLRTDHPLATFLSVQRAASTSDLTGRAFTELCIFRTLGLAIRHQLRRHRAIQDPARARLQTPSRQDLQRDFQASNAELEAWSLLYYRFVRVEFDLSVEEIARMVGQTVRTLHRRQQAGLIRLTHLLLRQEAKMHHCWRQALLRRPLPLAVSPTLFGREAHLKRAWECLAATAGRRHVLLYGERGVGKTALALALAHRLIDSDTVQHVLWLNHPVLPVDYLEREIATQLGMRGDVVPLPAWLHQEPSLVILDNGQALLDDTESFSELQAALAPARLIVCAERLHTRRIEAFCVPVHALDQTDAARLVFALEGMVQERKGTLVDDFDGLFQRVGGNPAALVDMLWQAKRKANARSARRPPPGLWSPRAVESVT